MKLRIRDTLQDQYEDKDIVMDWTENPKLEIDTGHGRFESIFLETEGDNIVLITPSGTIKIDTKKMMVWEEGKNPTKWLEVPSMTKVIREIRETE